MIRLYFWKCFCQCNFPKKTHYIKRFSNVAANHSPDLDFDYLCNPLNFKEIKENIKRRKGVGDIDKVLTLHKKWKGSGKEEKASIERQLILAALQIPNLSHPDINVLKDDPVVVKMISNDRVFPAKAAQFHNIARKFNVCRTENISNYTGPRSYYFIDSLSRLEHELINYALLYLKKRKFKLISVPDILPRSVIEYCGMDTRGERNQVYSLDEKSHGDFCLSGTAEIGIAYYLSKKNIQASDLPLRISAVSRCFRAETSKISDEKGVYRVHQFTKVEMFGACLPSQSESLLNEFVCIQEEMFDSLDLKLRTLDMPPPELGAQASRKFDVEVWLPGKEMWGEISSASNCTDYQSRRLGIKSELGYVHTINGTACAVPRLILALLESHQKEDGSIELPLALSKNLGNNALKKSRVPDLNAFKTKDRFN